MGLDDVRSLGQVIACALSAPKCDEKEKGGVSKNDQKTTSEPIHTEKQKPQQHLCWIC